MVNAGAMRFFEPVGHAHPSLERMYQKGLFFASKYRTYVFNPNVHVHN